MTDPLDAKEDLHEARLFEERPAAPAYWEDVDFPIGCSPDLELSYLKIMATGFILTGLIAYGACAWWG